MVLQQRDSFVYVCIYLYTWVYICIPGYIFVNLGGAVNSENYKNILAKNKGSEGGSKMKLKTKQLTRIR